MSFQYYLEEATILYMGKKSIFRAKKKTGEKMLRSSLNTQRKIYLRRKLLSFGIKEIGRNAAGFQFS